MNKLILRSLLLTMCNNNTPNDLENFYEEIYIFIEEEGTEGYALFKLYILSCKRLEKYEEHSDEAGMYLRFTLIMKYYDVNIIRKHIQQILDHCNLESPEKRYNYLSYYLRDEDEEDVYY